MTVQTLYRACPTSEAGSALKLEPTMRLGAPGALQAAGA